MAIIKIEKIDFGPLTYASGDEVQKATQKLPAALDNKLLYGIQLHWGVIYSGIVTTERVTLANALCQLGTPTAYFNDFRQKPLQVLPEPVTVTTSTDLDVIMILNRTANGAFQISGSVYVFFADANEGELIPGDIIKSIYKV